MPEVIACCAVLHNIALQNGDIIEPEVSLPPKPVTPKQDQENMCGPIWLLLYLLQTFVFLLSMTMTICKTFNRLILLPKALHYVNMGHF